MIVFIILLVVEFSLISQGSTNVEGRGELKLFDFAGAPMFFATTLNMFEGNAMILNLYSEADKP